MTIIESVIEVLKEKSPLTYKEIYQQIIEKDLYRFGAKNPEAVVNGEIRRHCHGLNFPSASVVKYFQLSGKRGRWDLYSLVEKEDDEGNSVTNTHRKRGTFIDEDMLPEEKIDLAYLFYKSKLKRQILDHILDCHPDFFEQLVVNLLLEMGYGYDDISGKALGRSHDGGIDGVIYEDKLGLSKIYIQAKRYDEKNTVGRPVLQAFVGAMEDVQKGVFITTSTFTKEARVYVEKQQQKSLKLIDGDLLAELMIKYGIGLEKVQIYTLYKIDEDYFE